MDKARKKTDKLLKDLERRVKEVYDTDPSLLRIQKKYGKYMDKVAKATKDAYLAYTHADNTSNRDELKQVYMEQIEALTIRNKEYKALVKEFSRIMADVNQKALDLINAEMPEIYAINYNQIGEVCKQMGIEVNGETEV